VYAEVDERDERRGERREVGYTFTAGVDTRTNKLCEIDKWVAY
jgi:hypothetical protein